MGEQRGSHARMQKPEKLEKRAVGAQEIDRKHGCSRKADKSGDAVVPFRIGNSTLFEIQVGYFSGRKHRQQSPLLEPGDGLLEAFRIGSDGVFAFERIDEDAAISCCGYRSEQVVGHDLHVGANGGEQRREDRPFDQAKRMIGHCDHGSVLRNQSQVLLGHFGAYVQEPEKSFRERTAVRQPLSFLAEVIETIQQEQPFERVFQWRGEFLSEKRGKSLPHPKT